MNIQNPFRIAAAVFSIAFIFSFMPVSAQEDDNHFIYIQADNKKPFYVILNDKLYSSSSIGYLIIPKLKSASYNLTLGFPQNAAPEQKFAVVVKDNDIGFALKALDSKNYSLTDLQTQQVLTSGKGAPSGTSNTAKQPTTVVQDLEPANAQKPPEKEEPVVAKARVESEKAAAQPEVATQKQPVAPPVENKVVVKETTTEVKQKPSEPRVEEKVVERKETTVTRTPVPAPAEEVRKNRSFGELMSDATNDPKLANEAKAPNPVSPKKNPFEEVKIVRSGAPEKVAEPVNDVSDPALKAPESGSASEKKPALSEVRQRPTVSAIPANTDTYGVIRTDSKTTTEGSEMSFKLLGNTSTETVTIIIPKEEEATAPMPERNNENTADTNTDKRKTIAYFDYDDLSSDGLGRSNQSPRESRRKRKKDRKSQAQEQREKAPETNREAQNKPELDASTPYETERQVVESQPANRASAPTADCSAGSISDRDFNKLRNKMIGRDNDTDMISTALDALGNSCIDTDKIKTLSGLFITDTGRLNFFNAIYKNVSDKQNFASLEDQIYDKGKKQQFRSQINK